MLPAVFGLRGQVSVQVAVATFAEVEMLIFRNDGANCLFSGPPKPPQKLATCAFPVALQVPLSAALRSKTAPQALLASTSLNNCVCTMTTARAAPECERGDHFQSPLTLSFNTLCFYDMNCPRGSRT